MTIWLGRKKPVAAFLTAIITVGLVLVLFPSTAFAGSASLYLSPSSGSYNIGNTFSVRVNVSSPSQAMNAVEATIYFPADKLDVTGLDKSGSIASLWVQEPSFGSGNINISAIVLNPGFTGSAGRVITINFRAKAVGTAKLGFSSASILANDGAGTNILVGASGASFDIAGSTTPPPSNNNPPPSNNNPPPSNTKPVPPAPIITSATYPDQNGWYTINSGVFSWNLPNNVQAINILVDRSATTDPGTKSDGLKSTWTFNNLEDGVWYVHLKFWNSNGWGPETNYKFQIDTVKPDIFNITPVQGTDNQFTFEAVDKTSGIDHYDVTIDGGQVQTWKDDGTHIYTVSDQQPGKHNLSVQAVDKAGNFIQKDLPFVLYQPAPAPVPAKKHLTIPWRGIGFGALGLLALIILILILYGVYKALQLVKHGLRGMDNISLQKAFNNLNQNVRQAVEVLEKAKAKRQLSKEESSVLGSLYKALNAKNNEKALVIASHVPDGSRVIEGIFDGQKMQGFDGKGYTVPANYASKSKIVEGDRLKLVIAQDGTFTYKQIGPVDRVRLMGELVKDGKNYIVVANNKFYRVLPEAVSYFQAEPGDEITFLMPKSKESEWVAIEHVIKSPRPAVPTKSSTGTRARASTTKPKI